MSSRSLITRIVSIPQVFDQAFPNRVRTYESQPRRAEISNRATSCECGLRTCATESMLLELVPESLVYVWYRVDSNAVKCVLLLQISHPVNQLLRYPRVLLFQVA